MVWVVFPLTVHIPGIGGKVFLYVNLYRRKISKLTPTEMHYLYFLYVPHNEFRAGRDSFHAPSDTFVSAQRHDTR